MKDYYSKLLVIAGKECKCVDNDEEKRCDACNAAGVLNECSEIMYNALKLLNKGV